jgi:hypothetical protein
MGPRVPAALVANERDALVAYNDEDTYREAGQGGFEIRTFVAAAAAAKGAKGEIWFYEPIPIFAVGCTIGVMPVSNGGESTMRKLLAVLLLAPCLALAQAYPTNPCASSWGSRPAEPPTWSRASSSPKFQEHLGQQVVIENRSGRVVRSARPRRQGDGRRLSRCRWCSTPTRPNPPSVQDGGRIRSNRSSTSADVDQSRERARRVTSFARAICRTSSPTRRPIRRR